MIVADITTNDRPRSVPTAVPIEPSEENGLNEPCYVICHELATLVRGRLDADPLGPLSPGDMWRVEEALMVALGTAAFPEDVH